MANKKVFKSAKSGKLVPPADTVNRAGGIAYKLGEKAALAQYAATGTFNDTFYAKAENQVSEVLALLPKIDVEFIGKVALYARRDGRMKDMPALLCAYLSTRKDGGLDILNRIFPEVIDNSRMLRNFVQIIRSGITGRKSLGTKPKQLVRNWFHRRRPEDIFRMSVGNDPSMKDIIHLAHVEDLNSPERAALLAYLYGTKDKNEKYNYSYLPSIVKTFEELKKAPEKWDGPLPKVPMEMLIGLKLNENGWRNLAGQMTWTQLRMNLSTLARHGIFKDHVTTTMIATKLRNKELVEKVKPFPYQLFITYLNTSETGPEAVPRIVRDALHDAMDYSVNVIPFIEGPCHALIDVSGSMSSAVTGTRKGSTSQARCVDVAAIIGSMFLRKNKESSIIAYSDAAILNHGCEARDSVMTNAKRLAKLGGGGTNLSAAFSELNSKKALGDLVLVASDMETWMDTPPSSWASYGGGTVPTQAWFEYKKRNPKAKLVCINLQAADHCQVKNHIDVLNIGGFSDAFWEVIQKFVEGTPSSDHWVDTINKIQLPIGETSAVSTPETSSASECVI